VPFSAMASVVLSYYLVHLIAAVGTQQLRQGIGSRENLCPAMQQLSGLLPGFAPAPSVLHLVEEVFNGPAAGVVFENLVSSQRTVGGEKQALLAECTRLVLEVHPHGPDLAATEEFKHEDSGPVTYPLPIAIEKHPMSALGQACHNNFRGEFVAILRRPAPFVGGYGQTVQRRVSLRTWPMTSKPRARSEVLKEYFIYQLSTRTQTCLPTNTRGHCPEQGFGRIELASVAVGAHEPVK